MFDGAGGSRCHAIGLRRCRAGLLAERQEQVSGLAFMSDQTLVDAIGCPHCGHRFPPEQFHFIARSPSLAYDHRLPEGERRRFLPSRFTFEGDAIDPGGATCSETACPECHLKVPRLLAVRRALTFSIFGSPSSGKSYLLGAMTKGMRRCTGRARLRFDDVDVEANAIVLDYEKRMFNQPSPDHWVTLEKTQEKGDWYSDVWFGTREDRNRRTFPKPFLFRLDPSVGHPEEARADQMARVVCLYDNAGEHYQASSDNLSLVTSHLKNAEGLIFVFDPTQDQAFRAACRAESKDPQFHGAVVDTQDILYGNVMNRILSLRGMSPTARVRTPLVVALTKFDAWSFLMETPELPDLFRDVSLPDGASAAFFDAEGLQAVSQACRRMLSRVAPQVLATIESRCEPSGIYYLPVTATGGPREGKTDSQKWPFLPEQPPNDGLDYFLHGKVQPRWAEVPMLALLHRAAPQLLPPCPA